MPTSTVSRKTAAKRARGKSKQAARSPRQVSEKTRRKKGRVGRIVAIGGHEEHSASGEILEHVAELAGGRGSLILVCAGASDEPTGTLKEYRTAFERLGCRVRTTSLPDREAGESELLVESVERADAVFFTGGDQLQLTAVMAGTAFGERVRARLDSDGLIVAGTSAGAAAMSSVMIIGGPKDGSVRRSDVRLAPGLGYWRDVVVDTHFSERGRVSRLLTLFAENPQIMGIGIDENTAASVTPGRDFRVLGTGVVSVFDGRVTHTNAPDADDSDALALFDARIHVLPRGYRFDLTTMRPVLPQPSRSRKRATAAPR